MKSIFTILLIISISNVFSQTSLRTQFLNIDMQPIIQVDTVPNIKAAGVHLEKAGGRLTTGVIVTILSTAIGAFITANDPNTNGQTVGLVIIGGGAIIGTGLSLSGYSELRKAGLVLAK